MAWTAPPSVVAGQLMTAAYWNTHVRDNENYLYALDVAGAWTPVLGGSTGTSGQSYSIQVGKYIKHGTLVTAYGRLALTAKGTISTFVQIQGLPFTSENTANLYSTLDVGFFTSLTTSWTWLGGVLAPNSTAADLTGTQGVATGIAQLTTADISNTTELIFSVTYAAVP
jgi:hypothetical protein